MPAPDHSAAPVETPPHGRVRSLLARDGPAVLAAAAATAAVELGVFFLARAYGAPLREATLATLAATTLWVVLGAPALAATGETGFSALLRGGTVADASTATLVVLWLATPYVTFLAGVQIYCMLAAVALAGIAAVRCFVRPLARAAAGVAAAAVLSAALATGFWAGGLLHAARGAAQRAVVSAAVAANPFYCVLSAIADKTHFVWHQASVMYRLTRIGDYAAPPPVHFSAAVVIYGLLAGVLGAVGMLRRRRRRTEAQRT